MSNTARTLRLLRSHGWHADVCERWIPGANIRRDLFGAFDIIALKKMYPGEPYERGRILAVQCCNACDMKRRRDKMAGLLGVELWLACGGQIVIIGWGKRGPANRKKWVPFQRPASLRL
jgi:hypothetical protein